MKGSRVAYKSPGFLTDSEKQSIVARVNRALSIDTGIYYDVYCQFQNDYLVGGILTDTGQFSQSDYTHGKIVELVQFCRQNSIEIEEVTRPVVDTNGNTHQKATALYDLFPSADHQRGTTVSFWLSRLGVRRHVNAARVGSVVFAA